MTIHLDHTIVPSRNRVAAARQLAEILDVPWVPTALGHFAAVYVNDGLTIDFIDTDEVFPIYHLCFRVDDATFDAILARLRAAGIAWRSTVRGPVDRDVDTSFGGEWLELVPGERIVHTDRFDDPNLPGEMTVTITLRKVLCGTEVDIVQSGIPSVIPPEMCHLGWQESLMLLTLLVEAEIPG